MTERESTYLRSLRAQIKAYNPGRDYGADYGALGMPYSQEMEVLQQGHRFRQQVGLMSQRVTPEMGSYASALLTDHASLGGNLLQTLLESQVVDSEAVDEVADADDGGLGLGILGDVAGWAADKARDALHLANEQAIKPFVRTLDLVGESAYHELSRAIVSIGTLSDDTGSGLGAVTRRYADYGDSNLVNMVQGQGEGMELGTGYFVGGPLKERTAGERNYEIEGQQANLGRFLASNTVGKMYDPGEAVYDVVAGVSEFGLAVALDPLAKVSQPLAAGRRARQGLVRYSDQVLGGGPARTFDDLVPVSKDPASGSMMRRVPHAADVDWDALARYTDGGEFGTVDEISEVMDRAVGSMVRSSGYQRGLRQFFEERGFGADDYIQVFRGGEDAAATAAGRGDFTNVTLIPDRAKPYGPVSSFSVKVKDIVGQGDNIAGEVFVRRSGLRSGVNEAAESSTRVERWKFNAGLLDDGRKRTIMAERTRDFLADPTLRESLAAATPYQIAQRWSKSRAGRFNLDIVNRLGNESDPDQIGRILEELVDQGLVENRGFLSGKGNFIRGFITESDNIVTNKLKWMTPEGKLAGISPRGMIHAEDLDTAVLKYDSLGRQAGVPRSVREEIFNEASKIPNGNFNELVKVHNKVMREVAKAVRVRGTRNSKLDDIDIDDLTTDQVNDLVRRGELEYVEDADTLTLQRVAKAENGRVDKIAARAMDELSGKFSEEFERLQKSAFRIFGLSNEGTGINPSYAPKIDMVDPGTGDEFTFTYAFPTAEAELGSMALSLPDPTVVRRAATKNAVARYVYNTKGWGNGVTLANAATARVFRPLALMRLAFGSREFIEGQMSLTAGGHSSMLNSPVQFLRTAWNLGEDGWRELLDPSYIRKSAEVSGKSVAGELAAGVKRRFEVIPTTLKTDEAGNVIRGEAWTDLMGNDWSPIARAGNIITTNAGGYFQKDASKAMTRLFSPVPFDQASKQNLINWTKEMGRLRASPSYVKMLKVNGNVDEWMDWAINSAEGRASVGALVRDAVDAGRVTYEDAAAELSGIVRERLSMTLGGTGKGDWDSDLAQRFLDGKIPMPESVKNGRLVRHDWNAMDPDAKEFMDLLRRKFDERKRPNYLKEEYVPEVDKMFETQLFQNLGEVIFNWAPSKFTRNPAMRARYIGNTANLMDMAATDELRDEVLEHAVKNLGIKKGSPEYLEMAEARTRARGIEGVVDNIEDYADLVRGRSVDEVMETVFDIPNRSAGQDTFIAILPFLDAWKESMQRWSDFVKDNPSFFVRAMSGVRELQNQGQFYTNDFGELVFQYPGSGALVQAINTLNGGRSDEFGVRMEGRVAGLNIATDSIGPGFGPLVQLSATLFKDPDMDSLRDMIAPFGVKVDNPANLPAVLGSLAPAWSQKLIAAFDKDYDPKAFNSQAAQFLDAFAMSGKYDLDDPEAVQQMVKDAERAARYTLAARAITQFTAPTGPGAAVEVPLEDVDRSEADWDPQVDPQGKWHTIYSIASDYHRLAEVYGWDTAGLKWFEMYGKEPFFVAQGGSTTEGRELPVTKEGDAWYRRNQDVVEDYELVAGYFAPADEDNKGLDYTAMSRQYLAGQRKTLSAKEQAQLAMSTRTRAMWNAIVRQTEGMPSNQKTRVREQVKVALEQANPGWQNPVIAFPRGGDKIKELRRAVDDSRLSDNPLTDPLRAYFEARDEALEAVRQRTGRSNSTLGVQAAADIRAQLRQVGVALQAKHPAFAGVWSNLLLSELEE